MNNSIYKFSLDIHEPMSQVVVELKQNDTAREFLISLTENGRPYVISENCFAVFTAKKPDGKIIYNECEIEGNIIRYTTTPQSTSVAGVSDCEIKLYGENNALITSPAFAMLVYAPVYQDGDVTESNNEFSALANIYTKSNLLYLLLNRKHENGEFKGKDGDSAYDIAVKNGFEGTEAEWVESLKLQLTKTEHQTINLFDNIFDEEGYIKNGVDISSTVHHRTNLRSTGKTTNTLRIRSTEASASLTCVLYNSEEELVDTLSLNNQTTRDVTLHASFDFFRLYTYKTSTAKILVTTEDVPSDLTQEELLELIEGKEVTTYLNEDFKNLVDEVKALKDDTVSISAEKETKISKVKDYAEKQENIRNFEKAYYVGADKEYTTIASALRQWGTDGYPKATVYISNGEYIADDENYIGADGYKSVIFVDTSATTPKTISFIGESREGVVLRTTKGNYEYAPVMVRHGNVEIKNMTVIADHSATPDFSYPTKSNGNRRTQAYALHIDGGNNDAFGENGARVLVENVTAISHQSPAFGMGTIPNSIIRLENCKAISYTESEENIYNAGLANSYGAVLCHSSSPDTYADRGSEKLELINVEAYAKNNDRPLCVVGNDSEDYNLLAINTVLVSKNGEGYLNSDKVKNLKLDEFSSGNTCDALNQEV